MLKKIITDQTSNVIQIASYYFFKIFLNLMFFLNLKINLFL